MRTTVLYVGFISMLTFSLLFTFDDASGGSKARTRKSTATSASGGTATREKTGVWDPETKTWKKNVNTTGEQGKTTTREVQGAKADNGYIRNSAVTGPNGESGTRSAMGVWDPETKTFKKDVSKTGPEGNTVNRESGIVKTEDGFTRNTTVTGPDGQTATQSATGVWDPETQSWTRSTTTVGADGKTTTSLSEATKTEDGYTRNSAAVGPNGEVITRTADGVWDPETKTWTRSNATEGPSGNVTTKVSQTTKTDEGYMRNSAVAGPDGNAVTRSATGVWDPVTKTWNKSAANTGPQGGSVTSQSQSTPAGDQATQSTTAPQP